MKRIVLLCLLITPALPIIASCIDTTQELSKAQKVIKKSDNKEAPFYFWRNSKEVCFNVNSLISQVVPFNLKEVPTGFSSIKTKWYGKKYAFRSEFGININSGFDDDILLYVGLGYEKRRNLHKNFHYTSGADGFLLIDNGNRSNAITLIGFNKFYGLEYHINNKFFVGTEAKLSLGVGSDLRLQFLPPVAIFAGIRL
jgi:hypothetical protein